VKLSIIFQSGHSGPPQHGFEELSQRFLSSCVLLMAAMMVLVARNSERLRVMLTILGNLLPVLARLLPRQRQVHQLLFVMMPWPARRRVVRRRRPPVRVLFHGRARILAAADGLRPSIDLWLWHGIGGYVQQTLPQISRSNFVAVEQQVYLERVRVLEYSPAQVAGVYRFSWL
jgi:hypothetical protein